MLTSLLFALTVGQAQVHPREPVIRPRVFRSDGAPRTTRLGADDYAFFEAFPLSGAGTTTPCATTAPTGAKGEASTTVRATSATCQSTAAGGMVSTGIANGELSTLGAGVARIEYDRQGVKGVRVESQRTNTLVRNQAFDDAAWLVDTTTPTVTANAAVAPDGTNTADQLATAAAGNKALYQSIGAGTKSLSAYVRGVSGSGTTYLINYGVLTCYPCNYVSTSWTKCEANGVTTTTNFGVGHTTFCATQAASDAYVWNAQGEVGAFPSTAIATAGVSVQRNADVISFPVTLSGSTFSAAASYDAPSVLASGATAFQIYKDANNSITASASAAGKLTCTFRIGGVDSTVDSAAALTASTVNRVACQYDGASRKACLGGTCASTAGALTIPTGAATFYVGTRAATGNEANGVLSQLCYDPADPRCI